MTGEVRKLHVPELLCDQPCELALAAEAMRAYPKYLARGVNPNDFTSQTARTVIDACAAVWEAQGAVNMTAVATELQRIGRIQFVGGVRGLADMSTGDATPDHERIKTLAALRSLKEAGAEVMRAAQAGDLPRAVEAAQEAERRAIGDGGRKVLALHEAVADLFATIRDEKRSASKRIHPGLPALHEAIGFLPVGSLMTIGADSNVGKSGFTLEMLIACAQRNVPCGLISVEDPNDVTSARALGAFSGVSSRKIQRGKFDADDMPAMGAGLDEIKKLGDRLMLADCTGETDLEVCAAMSQMAARGAKLIAVDYLTEVEASKAQKDRRNEIRWICRRLKTHAKRLGVSLVLVSQLARPQDKATGKRPTKHDLKESGDITNASEVILLLWREEEADAAPVKIWVAKCKWGGIGQWWEMTRSTAGRLLESSPVRAQLPIETKRRSM
jgi:replicative DNA helicase